MRQSPFEASEGLHIGTVDFVSPDEIKVGLDIEAPDAVALGAGWMTATWLDRSSG
jgi:hypothetical protein